MEVFFGMVRDAAREFVDNSRKRMYGVEDAASGVAQAISADPPIAATAALLCGRSDDPERTSRIPKWKDENECKVFGQCGHWWTDNTDYKEQMYKRRRILDDSDGTRGGRAERLQMFAQRGRT